MVFASALESSATSLPAYRLPGDVHPTHYHLHITTDLDDFTFQGVVNIKLKCDESTDTIYVHSRNLTIKAIQVSHIPTGNSVKDLPVTSIAQDEANDFIIIKLQERLTPDEVYQLSISFDGLLREDLAGYYRSSYQDREANTTKWLAVTHFESKDARRAFPCFDEPAMKAKFTIKLAHKEGLKAASNMPLMRSTPLEGKPDWVLDEFQETVPMSTYLVAYMISDFEFKESVPQPNNVQFRVWARRDAIDQVDFALKVGPMFLSYYEQFFDVKYPLPKQDMVAVPDLNPGAMENWGLITYRETTLLYDEKESSLSSLEGVASTVAHELAHQWFGNLVTMKWFTDIWLNEGFATYVASLGVSQEFPEWDHENSVAMVNALAILALDGLQSSHPVNIPIGNPNDIKQIYDVISYKKGAFLLRMMALFLGKEAFQQGVSSYLKKHEYGNAEQDDLWESLTDMAHKLKTLPEDMTVKQIMDSWTLQTGYPVLAVKRDYITGNATVYQKRYLAVKGKDGSEKGCWWVPLTYSTSSHLDFNDTRPRHWLSCQQTQLEKRYLSVKGKDGGEKGCWWVPLTYSTSSHLDFNNTRPRHWLSCQQTQLEVATGAGPDDWLIFNNRFAGLYRVNYDEQNWRLIAAALNSQDYTKIDVLNRVQLITDALDLAWGGDLDYSLAFQLIGYLRQETEYLPWRAALNRLSNIDKVLKRTSSYGSFQKYMQKLLKPLLARVGPMSEMPKTYRDIKLWGLTMSWASRYNIGDCNKQASQLFHQWREVHENNNPIPNDMRSIVYCKGVQEGGEEVWEWMWDQYRHSNVGGERTTILHALGCTTKDWLVNRLLEWSIDESSGIRRQDSPVLFSFIAQTDLGYFLGKQFFTHNMEKIHAFYGAYATRMGGYVAALANEMIYPDELEELKNVTETHKDLLKESYSKVRQSIESAEANIAWVRDNSKTIAEIFN